MKDLRLCFRTSEDMTRDGECPLLQRNSMDKHYQEFEDSQEKELSCTLSLVSQELGRKLTRRTVDFWIKQECFGIPL